MPELVADNPFINNPERYANRVVLDALVNDVFGRFELSVIVKSLENARIANGALCSVADLSDQVSLKNSVANIGDFNVSMAALPVESQNAGTKLVPTLGQHTEALWREFGGPQQ
jgi:itaconate CoA-transferase